MLTSAPPPALPTPHIHFTRQLSRGQHLCSTDTGSSPAAPHRMCTVWLSLLSPCPMGMQLIFPVDYTDTAQLQCTLHDFLVLHWYSASRLRVILQVSLSMSPCFCCSYFSHRVSEIFASHMAGIIVVHHAWLICWDEVSLTLLSWSQTTILSISEQS
jgi:hypothetical protein